MDDDPAFPAPNRDAVKPAASDEANQAVAVRAAGGTVQFGGVEVRKAHLDPGGRVGGVTHAQTVAIADVAYDPREGLPGAGGQPALARIGPGDGREPAGIRRPSEAISSAQVGAARVWQQARICNKPRSENKPRSGRERKAARRCSVMERRRPP